METLSLKKCCALPRASFRPAWILLCFIPCFILFFERVARVMLHREIVPLDRTLSFGVFGELGLVLIGALEPRLLSSIKGNGFCVSIRTQFFMDLTGKNGRENESVQSKKAALCNIQFYGICGGVAPWLLAHPL